MRRAGLRILIRHQIGALLASALDLGVMTACVELASLRPSYATAVGAVCGAIANFLFSRHVVFEAQSGSRAAQAVRYVLVSVTSLLLNAFGVWAIAERAGAPYFPARLGVSIAVSLAWNYPMHRWFVFRLPSRQSAAPAMESESAARG